MNRKILMILSVSFFFAFLFFIFTMIVKTDRLNQFDFNTTIKIQNHIPKRLDTFFSFFSLMGSIEVLAIILIALLVWRKSLKGVFVLVVFFSSHIIELVGKVFLHHPGPPFLLFRKNEIYTFSTSYIQPGSSYPSGHSFRIFFVSIIAAYLISRIKNINIQMKSFIYMFLIAISFLIPMSKVLLGEHWSTDVVAGALFGIAAGIFSLLFI